MDDASLAQIPEHLRAKVAESFALNVRLEQRNALLCEYIRLLRIKKFGPSAERLSDAQLLLLALEPIVSSDEVAAEAALDDAAKDLPPPPKDLPKTAKAPPKQPVRAALPAHLPRIERIVRCSEAQCHCGQCGELKKNAGFEISERLSMKPIEFFVEVTKREKLACKKCEEMGVCVAPVPPSIVEKGILADRLVIDALIKKFAEHNPFYRQSVGILRDAGLAVSQATLGSSVLKAGALLIPVAGAMRKDLLAGGYIQADETTVPVQSKAVKGKNHQAYLWEYSDPHGVVIYIFRMGREREGPKSFLGDFNGWLQSDGYVTYDKIGGPQIVYFGCMAHSRRRFFDASKANPKDALSVAIVAKIGELYDIEACAREHQLDFAAREALRQEKSVPLLLALKPMILEAQKTALPQSLLGKACTYALNQWERLERYAAKGYGRVEIDNNRAENGMRRVALGRKNWLHIGSEETGPKVAAILTVLETCQRLGINAREYLEDVVPRIADWPMSRIAELTPSAWLLHRTAA